MAGDMKALIADKLLELAKKRGMDKVTVNQLVEMCGISRQTFYYHYPDIVAVAQGALRNSLEAASRRSAEIGEPVGALRLFTEEMVRNSPALSVFINSKLRKESELLLLTEMKRFIRSMLTENGTEWGVALTKKRLDFCADFFACGMTAFMMEHCRDKAFDVEAFVEQMTWMLEGILKAKQ